MSEHNKTPFWNICMVCAEGFRSPECKLMCDECAHSYQASAERAEVAWSYDPSSRGLEMFSDESWSDTDEIELSFGDKILATVTVGWLRAAACVASQTNLAADLTEARSALTDLVACHDKFKAGDGNFEGAYYHLAKHAGPCWAKARAAIAKAGGHS